MSGDRRISYEFEKPSFRVLEPASHDKAQDVNMSLAQRPCLCATKAIVDAAAPGIKADVNAPVKIGRDSIEQ